MILSPMMERRITLRLIAYWEKLRRQRTMPSETDIDPDDLQEMWDYCFLIHVKDLEKNDYNYTYLGKAIQHAYVGELVEDGTDGLTSPNATKLAHSYSQVIEKGTPLVEEGEFHNLHNDLVKYRQCMLPLGDGDKVEAIFGGMRFKIFTANSSQALDSEKAY